MNGDVITTEGLAASIVIVIVGVTVMTETTGAPTESVVETVVRTGDAEGARSAAASMGAITEVTEVTAALAALLVMMVLSIVVLRVTTEVVVSPAALVVVMVLTTGMLEPAFTGASTGVAIVATEVMIAPAALVVVIVLMTDVLDVMRDVIVEPAALVVVMVLAMGASEAASPGGLIVVIEVIVTPNALVVETVLTIGAAGAMEVAEGVIVVTKVTVEPAALVVETVLKVGAGAEALDAGYDGMPTVMTVATTLPWALVVETVVTMAGGSLPMGMILRASSSETASLALFESAASELAATTGADAGSAAEVCANGAIHLVQMVEMEVLVIVEIVVVTCWTGFPKKGVMVVVTGQLVTVV